MNKQFSASEIARARLAGDDRWLLRFFGSEPTEHADYYTYLEKLETGGRTWLCHFATHFSQACKVLADVTGKEDEYHVRRFPLLACSVNPFLDPTEREKQLRENAATLIWSENLMQRMAANGRPVPRPDGPEYFILLDMIFDVHLRLLGGESILGMD